MASFGSTAPGVVHCHSGGEIVIGEPCGGTSKRNSDCVQVLSVASLPSDASDDIRRDPWIKLLGNVCSNPLSLVTLARIEHLPGDPGTHALFASQMAEFLALGLRAGLTLDIAQRIAQARHLRAVRSLMLRDLRAGGRVGIEAILGAPLECAAKLDFKASIDTDRICAEPPARSTSRPERCTLPLMPIRTRVLVLSRACSRLNWRPSLCR